MSNGVISIVYSAPYNHVVGCGFFVFFKNKGTKEEKAMPVWFTLILSVVFFTTAILLKRKSKVLCTIALLAGIACLVLAIASWYFVWTVGTR